MTIGLTLSGGGARGIAHIGVIKALEDMQLKISHLSGVSMGGIIAALYAYGYSADDILNIIRESSLFRIIRPSWKWSGLLSLERLGKLLRQYMPEDNFEALQIPLSISATEISKAKTHYFTKGELASVITLSCAVPGLFQPIRFSGGTYVDGGLLDNLPSAAIRHRCDFLIGSHCNPISYEFDALSTNFKNVVERCAVIVVGAGVEQSKRLCNMVIEPKQLSGFSGFDMGKAQQLFDIGYSFTKRNYSIKDFRL